MSAPSFVVMATLHTLRAKGMLPASRLENVCKSSPMLSWALMQVLRGAISKVIPVVRWLSDFWGNDRQRCVEAEKVYIIHAKASVSWCRRAIIACTCALEFLGEANIDSQRFEDCRGVFVARSAPPNALCDISK